MAQEKENFPTSFIQMCRSLPEHRARVFQNLFLLFRNGVCLLPAHLHHSPRPPRTPPGDGEPHLEKGPLCTVLAARKEP